MPRQICVGAWGGDKSRRDMIDGLTLAPRGFSPQFLIIPLQTGQVDLTLLDFARHNVD